LRLPVRHVEKLEKHPALCSRLVLF